MSSYDVAMDLLKLSDEEFAEVFAWLEKSNCDLCELDKKEIDLSKSDMYKTIEYIDTLHGMLSEIITDSECCPSAWWKSPTPKQKSV